MMSDDVQYVLAQVPGVRRLLFKQSIAKRVRYGVWTRPHFGYGVYHAADQAVRLGVPAISVIEMGVAGGNGLLALEGIAAEIGAYFGIGISVFGFDLGSGLPRPVDYRDVPHAWEEGFFKMDQDKLRGRLKHASLIIGEVDRTVLEFIAKGGFPPIGFVSFDLDYYSSTRSAFGLFAGSFETRLPRTYCYFDDLMWPDLACQNKFIGELCAIRDFNVEHEFQKICPIYGLRYRVPHFPLLDRIDLRTPRFQPSVIHETPYSADDAGVGTAALNPASLFRFHHRCRRTFLHPSRPR